MPTYEFRCTNGHTFDEFHKISDAPKTATCAVCGGEAARAISGGAGLVFKGSGFYLTDYGKNAHRGTAPPAGGDSKSGDAKAGDAKSAEGKAGEGKGPESKGETKGDGGTKAKEAGASGSGSGSSGGGGSTGGSPSGGSSGSSGSSGSAGGSTGGAAA
jgi:putative FmdB family regulatory protein